MYTKRATIINKTGLHARPASTFVGTATKFKSNITIGRIGENGQVEKTAPAKSIVYLLTLMLNKGTEIEITAEGEDEQAAVDTLIDLIESGFGEL